MQCIKGSILNTMRKKITINNALFQNAFKNFYLIGHAALLQEAKEFNWSSERILGLNELPKEMDEYFEIFENMSASEFEEETINITLFESVKLPCGKIIRASDSFYNAPFYSDVSVQMSEEEALDYESNDGKCYGKVCCKFFFITSTNDSIINNIINSDGLLIFIYCRYYYCYEL